MNQAIRLDSKPRSPGTMQERGTSRCGLGAGEWVGRALDRSLDISLLIFPKEDLESAVYGVWPPLLCKGREVGLSSWWACGWKAEEVA